MEIFNMIKRLGRGRESATPRIHAIALLWRRGKSWTSQLVGTDPNRGNGPDRRCFLKIFYLGIDFFNRCMYI